jgi:hypothetical protein
MPKLSHTRGSRKGISVSIIVNESHTKSTAVPMERNQ